MLVPKELGCCVRWRAAERVEHLRTVAQCAEAKVPHLHTRAAGVEDIFRLQVAVDDVVFMLWYTKRNSVTTTAFQQPGFDVNKVALFL